LKQGAAAIILASTSVKTPPGDGGNVFIAQIFTISTRDNPWKTIKVLEVYSGGCNTRRPSAPRQSRRKTSRFPASFTGWSWASHTFFFRTE
jgi:hypothetical protein